VLTVSWLRAYHSPMIGPVGDAVDALEVTGLVRRKDDQAANIYDIQALRLGHFATADGPRFVAEGTYEGAGGPRTGTWRGRTHLLFHASGFVLLRLTISSVDNPHLDHEDASLIRTLERLPWDPHAFTWTVLGGSVTGNVRACMNLVFLHLLDALPGAEPLPDLPAKAVEGPKGWEHLHELCASGRLSHPYPVSFGTHIEVADPSLVHDPVGQQALLEESLLAGVGPTWQPDNLEPDAQGLAWYLLENQSVVFRETADDPNGVLVDPTRTALLEYLTLRRAALRSVQRDTQRVLSGRRHVSRRRLHEWQLLVQTATDDYVLSDRAGQVLSLVRSRLAQQARVRNPDALEEQVRSNLASFTTAMDHAGSRVTAAVGALFAILAATAVFSAPLRLGLDLLDGGLGSDPYAEVHPLRSAGVDVAVAAVAAALFFLLVRRFASRLHPPRLHR
jgi:hypothetical protein